MKTATIIDWRNSSLLRDGVTRKSAWPDRLARLEAAMERERAAKVDNRIVDTTTEVEV